MLSINTDYPPRPIGPKPTGSTFRHPNRTYKKISSRSPIKPNSSPIETRRERRSYNPNPFSGGKKSRKRRIRKSKKHGKHRTQNKKTFRFF